MNKRNIDDFCKESALILDMRMRQNAKKNKCGFPGGFRHAKKIWEICYELNRTGKTFYTEAVFKNGSRADIFVLDMRTAIEVVDSEEETSIEKKRKEYPCPIVAVGVCQEFKMEMIE